MAALTIALSWTRSASPVFACDLTPGSSHSVVQVFDGETVQLDDGRRLRLAGIVAPRAADVGAVPGQWPPELAARAALKGLAAGRSVALRFDAQRRDRHDQWLAHLDVPSGPSLPRDLLASGHARVEAARDQRGCLAPLLEAEDAARAANLGLWQEAAYRVRRAEPVRDLQAYRGTFQIITGTVGEVRPIRGAWSLALGPDARRALRISLRTDDRAALGALTDGDPTRLKGQTVEVRGWLVGGPGGRLEIDLSVVGHLRRVSTGAALNETARTP